MTIEKYLIFSSRTYLSFSAEFSPKNFIATSLVPNDNDDEYSVIPSASAIYT